MPIINDFKCSLNIVQALNIRSLEMEKVYSDITVT